MGSGISKENTLVIKKSDRKLINLNQQGIYCEVERAEFKLSKTVLYNFMRVNNFSSDSEPSTNVITTNAIKQRNTKIHN